MYTLRGDSPLYTVQEYHKHQHKDLCNVHSGRLNCWGIPHQVCILGDSLELVPHNLAGKNMLAVSQSLYTVNLAHKAKDCKGFRQEQE
ncbi:hypothetical protein ANN_21352 [Periplaneta americana]|uniref:Uncharacterized protein n=1 Tax=Periplaneta americana TaxID=6978 RepID=A0ABQ8SF59_PERAM|nr:hypothetical protein ANN_21352 [Periplaneta americana]